MKAQHLLAQAAAAVRRDPERAIKLIAEASALLEVKPKDGVNPVTFRGTTRRGGKESVNVSVARVHLGVPDPTIADGPGRLSDQRAEEIDKIVMITAWNGPEGRPNVLANAVIPEENFIEGLSLLFPKGELR